MDAAGLCEGHAAEISGQAAAMGRAVIDRNERAALVERMLIVHARKDAVPVLAACDAVLMALRDKLPEPVIRGGAPYFSSQRMECEHWADSASDGQIAAMLSACLDRIGGARVAVDDRKRLLVAIWNGLSAEDRRAFRDRVMPKDPSFR